MSDERKQEHRPEHGEPRVDPDVAESLEGSNPNGAGPDHLEGGIGVSSERVGHTGPGQRSTDGLRDVSPDEFGPGEDAPPEQTADGQEPGNPARMGRKSAYPEADPRAHGEEPDEQDPGLR
ncbi:hypothetical protein [Nocardioides campestrisoli]|uniref:hypothetical protein n=1 Tax=Nocardioides campestrisoli TaxID=2736757 RepID=UPI00163DCEBB|nr:hypothetical protein [Nocardioides campestrisoli]